MPSPFPGMDPYLERPFLSWDVRATMLVHFKRAFIKQVDDPYYPWIREYNVNPPGEASDMMFFIDIVNVDTEAALTTVEVLCQSQKRPGKYRDAYVNRVRDCLASGVNVIEIDLWRGGERCLAKRATHEFDYAVATIHADESHRVTTWTIRDRLPVVEVPLQSDDVATIDLGACFEQAFDESGYYRLVNYSKPLDPPVAWQDRSWVEERIKQHLNYA